MWFAESIASQIGADSIDFALHSHVAKSILVCMQASARTEICVQPGHVSLQVAGGLMPDKTFGGISAAGAAAAAEVSSTGPVMR